MVVALVVLAILLAVTPMFGIVGNNAAAGLVCATVGLATVATVTTLQPGAIRKLNVLLRPALLGVLLAPLGWMLMQIAPMPLHWLSDPVWASTSAALNLPIAGSVAIDIGATLLSIVRYSGLLATALIVAASTSARQSAERMFYALTAIAAFVAGLQIIREMGYIGSSRGGASDTSGAEAIAAIGMILACSALIHILEQLRTKRARVAFPTRLTIGLSAATAALFLCTASITLPGGMTVLLAGSLGAGVTISIFVIRTLSLGSWGKAGVGAALFLMLLLGLLAVTPMKTDIDPTIALSSKSEISSDLMLSDLPLLGRGAGSIDDLLPIYHQLKSGLSGSNATAAAIIAVEMGRIFLWMFIAALAAGVVILVRGSLIRNRDYVYAACGAGILVAFSLAMFVSTDVLSLPASLLASATLGLAWAQARSAKENRFSVGQSGAAIDVSPLHQGPFYLDRPGLRLGFVLFGLVLSAEAAWVVIPEFLASGAEPDGTTNSVVTLSQSKNLENAASIALVRGDLWARSATVSAMFLNKNASPSVGYDHVRDIFTRALRFAPYQGHAWLTLALLADQYERSRYDLTALLKMVYYTAANDINLVPARTKLALSLNASALDVELQDMIRRDLTLILQQLPNLRPALLDAYRAATPAGRALAERMITGIDPGFLKTAQGQ